MPGIGGLSVANNLLANNASLNLNRNQDSLKNIVTQLSSGLRINTAADDPSGLAIAESLQAQVNGFDQAVRNVQDANNASTVAEGALQTETDILQRVRSLAVQASSDITSINDKTNLQVEVNQLLLEVNRISQNTSFNGQQLLDGSHAGFQTAVNGFALVSANSALGIGSAALNVNNTNSGFLVASFLLSSTAAITINQATTLAAGENAVATSTQDGTIELQVVQTGQNAVTGQFSIGVQVTFFNSASGGVSVGPVIQTANFVYAGASAFDNVSITLGNFSTNDVGTTSYLKVSQFVALQSNPTHPAFNFQSGANEGSTIQVGFNATNTSTLRISNINLLSGAVTSPSIGAEDAIGQIDNALQVLLQQRAKLGAVIVRLNEDANNDNIASVNLQASESGIRDLNVGQATTQYTKLQILVQVGTSVLAQSNTNAQSVLSLFR